MNKSTMGADLRIRYPEPRALLDDVRDVERSGRLRVDTTCNAELGTVEEFGLYLQDRPGEISFAAKVVDPKMVAPIEDALRKIMDVAGELQQ